MLDDDVYIHYLMHQPYEFLLVSILPTTFLPQPEFFLYILATIVRTTTGMILTHPPCLLRLLHMLSDPIHTLKCQGVYKVQEKDREQEQGPCAHPAHRMSDS